MEIVESKILEKKVNQVEVFGVKSTFHGDVAGVISNKNEREFNVVITYGLERIKARHYVFPILVNRERAEELYNNLR